MQQGKPYSDRIRGVISHLANSNPEYKHTFMEARPVKRVGFIVVSSDRGLCGGLNVNLFRTVVKQMAELDAKGVEVDMGLIGTKRTVFRSVGRMLSLLCPMSVKRRSSLI